MEIGPATATPEEVEVSSSSSAADEPSSAGSSPGASSCGSNDNIPGDNSNRMSKYELLDEDEEEDVCRICRNPGDVENPLRYPAHAAAASSLFIRIVFSSGSITATLANARYISSQGELDGSLFSFTLASSDRFWSVYADNAPARLPFQEFIIGIAMKACHVLQFFVRLSFVLSVWLLIIPFITFWIWRLAFVRSFGEAQRLFLSHLSTTVILTDCLHGFLLSASIVFIFLGATSLRDYFRHLRELGGQDADREDEGDRNGARAARRQVAQANRNIVVDGNGEDGGAQGVVVAGQMIRRNAENVAARWEMQAARLEAHVEQMFDGLDDADGAEDVPFDELVGMQGPVFHLVENAFTVLASNMIFLGVIIFVPFSLGRVILYYLSWLLSSATSPVLSAVVPLTESALSLANITLKNALTAVVNLTSDNHENLKVNTTAQTEVLSNISSTIAADLLKVQSAGASRLSDATTLAVGYMFIFSLVIFYLGIITLIRYSRGEPLTMGRFYGVASIAETIPSLFRQFVAAMRHLMTMIKVAFLLVIELGVFPLMCGIVYMLQISIFVSLLRGVLRNGVLYFLRDPADPNYNPFRDLIDDPVHKHARRVLLSVAVYGSLIVMLVYLPVKLAIRMAPSIFPLDISISDPFTEIPADMLLFQICIPFAIEHFKLRHTLKSLLRYWFTAVGWTLGLTDFLLPKPEEENANGDPGRQDRGHAQAGGQEQALALEDVNRPRYVPEDTNSGRSLTVMNQLTQNLYAFVIGSYVVWTASAGARYCAEFVRTRRTRLLLHQIWKWFGIIVKSSALLSIWIFVIPVLIGLLFELLVIVPMRVPVDESPVFLLYQDWALGLIFLKIWTRLVMLDHMMPLVDESWRIKFERVREDGFSRLQGLWVLREIVSPIIMKLLTALCVPYVLARGIFPVLGYPLVVNSAVYRFAWLGCLFFSLLYFCAKRFHVWFTNLHNSIRDDRYLIGRRLHNYGENLARQADSSVALENQGSIGNDTDVNQNIQEAADVGLRQRNVLRQDA
ncbi:UNVERIFIED_CONTAM: putative E3 ubiquitin ligase SUD1 [Sesamum calycinum]|uniref:RING-type E3 ubiquitin transferase n=1 Tax=Sesamum calycinum TaxID=2727403 RepID=A0AAW2R7Y6_9LAMI